MKSEYGDGLVTCDVEGGVAHLGLNQPERRNPIGGADILAIEEAVGDGLREDISRFVFWGRGKHFSSGADLDESVGVFARMDDDRDGAAAAEFAAGERAAVRLARTLREPHVYSV